MNAPAFSSSFIIFVWVCCAGATPAFAYQTRTALDANSADPHRKPVHSEQATDFTQIRPGARVPPSAALKRAQTRPTL